MNDINILWVDDEIDILKPHIIFLEKKGYTVSTCNNGADAIDMCSENNYDIVFLDVQMPYKSGFDLLKSLKKINLDDHE
ncbi:MAG: hypothetical protein COC22_02995 [Flavobacteriaceae bacterium]|nr:MAG: hypothetical protein COC22_02995 [Flavobacteriaceae bacterium]